MHEYFFLWNMKSILMWHDRYSSRTKIKRWMTIITGYLKRIESCIKQVEPFILQEGIRRKWGVRGLDKWWRFSSQTYFFFLEIAGVMNENIIDGKINPKFEVRWQVLCSGCHGLKMTYQITKTSNGSHPHDMM